MADTEKSVDGSNLRGLDNLKVALEPNRSSKLGPLPKYRQTNREERNNAAKNKLPGGGPFFTI